MMVRLKRRLFTLSSKIQMRFRPCLDRTGAVRYGALWTYRGGGNAFPMPRSRPRHQRTRRHTRRHVHRPAAASFPGWAFLFGLCLLLGCVAAFVWTRKPPHAPQSSPTQVADQRSTPARLSSIQSTRPAQAPPVATPQALSSEPAPPPANPNTAAVSISSASAPTPPQAFSPLWRDDPLARHEPHAAGHPVHVEQWTFESPMSLYPTLTAEVCIPLGVNGAPLPTSADVVLSFPYPDERSAVEGRVRTLATKYGFTLLTIRFPPSKTVPAGHHRDYYFPEHGSDKAWIAALEQAREKFGLPERRVFATGRSGGGSAVQQFSEAHPHLIDGYHSEAGRYFTATHEFPGAVLLTFGEGDTVESSNRTLIDSLTASGNVPWVLPFRTNQDMRSRQQTLMRHCQPPNVDVVVWAWLAGIANMRLEHRGTLPPRSHWPNAGTAEAPSPHCAELAGKLAPASNPIPGIAGWIVRPAGIPRAVVALAWRDIGINPDELWMDGHLLADKGFIAVIGADPGISIPTHARRLADHEHLPLILGFTGAEPKVYAEVTTLRPAVQILINPRHSLQKTLKAPRIPTLLYLNTSNRAKWDNLAGEMVTVAELPHNQTSAGAWHVSFMRNLVKRLDERFPPPTRNN